MTPLTRHQRAHGFTLIELLVVVAIIGIMMALLMSAVQKVREAAARTQCQNNLHNIGLALFNYQQVERTFPAGNERVNIRYHGHAWWSRLLPYLEQDVIFRRYDFTQDPERGCVFNNTINNPLLINKPFAFLVCPASPLEHWAWRVPTQKFANSNYAGVAGSVQYRDVYKSDVYPQLFLSFGGIFNEIIIPGNGPPVLGGTNGQAFHISGKRIRLRDVRDGVSNTLAVVEQSGWCKDSSGANVDCRAGGRDTPFTMGICCADWLGPHTFLTTVRHPVGFNSADGLGATSPNTPIQSAHSGGASVVMVDGSVHFLSSELNISTLYALADRDDGVNANWDGR